MATAAPKEAHDALDEFCLALTTGNPQAHGTVLIEVEYRDGEPVFVRPLTKDSRPLKRKQ